MPTPFWFGKAVWVRQDGAAAVLGRQVERLRFWFRNTWCFRFDAALVRRLQRLRFWCLKTCYFRSSMPFWFGRLKPLSLFLGGK